MRRPTKNFTVEVKRRNARAPAVFIETAQPKAAKQKAPVAADAFFKIPIESDEGGKDSSGVGRVLPCLVTEASLSASGSQQDPIAHNADSPVRKRGRPRKAPVDDAQAQKVEIVRQKRGRPRKIEGAPVKQHARTKAALATTAVNSAKPASAIAVDAFQPLPAPAVEQTWKKSSRAAARSIAALGLARGDRWRRRLPKVLW